MADMLDDRGELGTGEAVPVAEVVKQSEGRKRAEMLLWVGTGVALIATMAGMGIGYAVFHSTKANSNANVGKPSGVNVENSVNPDKQLAGWGAIANGQVQPGAGQAAQAGVRDCPNLAPGTAHDVNCQPLMGNQTVMQGQGQMQGRAMSPAAQRIAAARQVALAQRRSQIMAFSGAQTVPGGAPAMGQRGIGGGQPVIPGQSQAQGLGGAGNGGSENRQGSGFGFVNQKQDARPANTDFSGQLAHSAIQTVRATVVGNRSFLLSAGTLVPCSLQTAINSTQAGFVSCVINHDIFSEDGRVVLLDKGTKVLGQYAGGIEHGQARLFVVWTRALTPRGIAIDLGSPAADELGRSGVAGGIDSQFWQRFGSALMLSVIEDGMNVAGQSIASYGSNTTQVPANTAAIALQNSINIKPVLKKNQGEFATIFVAKDFDFSPVYSVKLRR